MTSIGLGSRICSCRRAAMVSGVSGMPCCHVACVRRPVGAWAEEPVVEVRIDMVGLDEPHEVHGVGAAGEPAVGLENIIAYGLGAGDAFVADLDGAGTVLDRKSTRLNSSHLG